MNSCDRRIRTGNAAYLYIFLRIGLYLDNFSVTLCFSVYTFDVDCLQGLKLEVFAFFEPWQSQNHILKSIALKDLKEKFIAESHYCHAFIFSVYRSIMKMWLNLLQN
jgi:hypothetical protein